MAPITSTERMSLIIAVYLAVKAVECYGEDKIGVMLSTSEGFIYTRKIDIYIVKVPSLTRIETTLFTK